MTKLLILNSVIRFSEAISERLFLIEELCFKFKNSLGLNIVSVKKFDVFWPSWLFVDKSLFSSNLKLLANLKFNSSIVFFLS